MGITPKALLSRPALDQRQLFYYSIFTEISGDRGRTDMAPLPLTTFDIKAYCEFYGIDDLEQRASIALQVKAMDRAYLEKAASKRNDNTSQT